MPSDEGDIAPPMALSDGAQAVWDRLAPDLADKSCLTAWDVDAFAAFCEAVATYHECRILMGRNYIDKGAAGGVIKSPYWQIMRDCVEAMVKLGSRFGLTPGDRAALRIDSSDDGPRHGAERILG